MHDRSIDVFVDTLVLIYASPSGQRVGVGFGDSLTSLPASEKIKRKLLYNALATVVVKVRSWEFL